jgi:hypothetical protein
MNIPHRLIYNGIVIGFLSTMLITLMCAPVTVTAGPEKPYEVFLGLFALSYTMRDCITQIWPDQPKKYSA